MRLPLFPLHTVLFPHLPLPLHIFEPRYRAMTRDVLADGSPYRGRFVVSMIGDGAELGAPAGAHAIGTICGVRDARQLPDGRWTLLAIGVARARLADVDASGSYATVEAQALPEPDGQRAADLLPAVQAALDGYLATVKRFVAQAASGGHDLRETSNVAESLDEVLKPIRLPRDPAAASYAVGGVLQVELAHKQQLLELPDAAARLKRELELLRRESRLLAGAALTPIPADDLGYHPN